MQWGSSWVVVSTQFVVTIPNKTSFIELLSFILNKKNLIILY